MEWLGLCYIFRCGLTVKYVAVKPGVDSGPSHFEYTLATHGGTTSWAKVSFSVNVLLSRSHAADMQNL